MPELPESFADLLNSTDKTTDEKESFSQAMKGVKPLKQDKIHVGGDRIKQNRVLTSNNKSELRNKLNKTQDTDVKRFLFSDEYEPLVFQGETLSFVRDGHPAYLAKLIRRGELPPEIILDLHGYNKEQAKIDIADLIENCKQQHIACACIVHGVSGGILKTKVPHYLIQHPDVAALHQAPLEWGGQGAVVFVVDLGEELEFLLKR